jgi:hypothetical protein
MGPRYTMNPKSLNFVVKIDGTKILFVFCEHSKQDISVQ